MRPANRSRRPMRPASGEVLCGFHSVREALVAGRRRVDRVMVDRKAVSPRQGQIVELAESRHIPVQPLTPEAIAGACGSHQHQGIAMAVSAFPVDDLADLIFSDNCLVVVLDGIVDPHNLGAIIRSAHCVGADAVVIPKDRAAGPTPAVSRASAGALEHIQLCRVTNVSAAIKDLKQKGIWVAGLSMEAEKTLFESDFKGPLALVVGGEEKGVRPLVRQHCDFLISIPLYGRIDSLNASTAAAVALYEICRQRRFLDTNASLFPPADDKGKT
ncbi:23S rRNA (guanosine(2251)-2'-O)-methyltransferase RlmB [Desulfosarcina sp. OttesenSCG-928-G17]|nr:23S rRNA (guanosine(2251)-2'-O)-methyltransferase RlmB [Desulfosarcina sp. OttesenSCG-928-G17]